MASISKFYLACFYDSFFKGAVMGKVLKIALLVIGITLGGIMGESLAQTTPRGEIVNQADITGIFVEAIMGIEAIKFIENSLIDSQTGEVDRYSAFCVLIPGGGIGKPRLVYSRFLEIVIARTHIIRSYETKSSYSIEESEEYCKENYLPGWLDQFSNDEELKVTITNKLATAKEFLVNFIFSVDPTGQMYQRARPNGPELRPDIDASNIENGTTESDTGDKSKDLAEIREAFKAALKAAQAGDVKSQAGVAWGYYFGMEVVPQNFEEAFRWAMNAAQQGDTDGQFLVAAMYLKGEGVEQNNEESFNWFMKVAQQGYSRAQFTVGNMYKKGTGVPLNLQEAFKWCLKAAQNGEIAAPVIVGDMYFDGEGVSQDYQEAFKWYLEAAQRGDTKAQRRVGRMYYLGQGTSQNYVEAFAWSSKAAQ